MDAPLTASWVWQNWALVAMAGTCASLLAFAVWLLGRYVRTALNIFMDTPPPGLGAAIDYALMHGEITRFRSFDGTSLRGMRLAARGVREPKGTIIFCHEFGSDMFSCARYARALLEAGFDIFTFDFRAHGASSHAGRHYRPLQWPSDKELADALGACAHVQNELDAQGRDVPIGIFGVSRGAGAALLAAATDANIKAVCCDGAFSSDTTLQALMKRWASIFARVKLAYENHPPAFWALMVWVLMRVAERKLRCRYPSVRKALANMQPRPVFFIHGQRDAYIQVDQTRLLYEAAPAPKYLWLVPGARHNQSVATDAGQYAQRTVAFFLRHLAGEAVDEARIARCLGTSVA